MYINGKKDRILSVSHSSIHIFCCSLPDNVNEVNSKDESSVHRSLFVLDYGEEGEEDVVGIPSYIHPFCILKQIYIYIHTIKVLRGISLLS